MKRGNSGQIKVRKKSTFRPIVLTSKSIRPMTRTNIQRLKPTDKSNFQQLTATRKTTNLCPTHQNSFNRSQIVKKMTQQYRNELLKNIRQQFNSHQNHPKKFKQLTASVIHVQFDCQQKQKKLSIKHQPHLQFPLTNPNNPLQFIQPNSQSIRKYFYSTNSKILQNFINLNKNKMVHSLGFGTSNLIRTQSNKQSNQWNKCISKMYLNVKKLYPCKKKKIIYDQLNQHEQSVTTQPIIENQPIKPSKPSQQQIKQIIQLENKITQSQNKLNQKTQTRTKISTSCLDTVSEQPRSLSPQPKPLQKPLHSSDFQKIQADILTKRQTTKKQHFVFGLSQITKIIPQSIVKQKFEIYKDFLWKINYSNGLYVYLKDQIDFPYKLYVGPGNNSMLIKGIMKRRFWWQVVEKCTDQVNFAWAQSKINQFFLLQLRKKKQLNHNPSNSTNDPHNPKLQSNQTVLRKVHSAVSRSNTQNQQLTTQSRPHPPTQKPDQLPNTQLQKIPQTDSNIKIFKGKDYQIWQNHYRTNKKYQKKLQRPISKRIKTMVKKKPLLFIQQSKYLKIHNHFQCNYYLGNKKALFYSMRKYYTLLKKDPYSYLPLTFHIQRGLDDPQYLHFLQKYQSFQQKKKNKQCQNIWIVKPGQMTNRGRGITICSILDDIKIRLKSKQRAKNGQIHTYIVQKYIQKPLLYNKRKFDIRHYMLMTCVNGKFKGYWYQQGYLRTTSYQYNIKNCRDLYTHLTNDAIQKYSIDYGKYQKGNKVSYIDFQKYLNQTYKQKKKKSIKQNKYDFFNYILPQMKNLATDTMKATYMILSPHRYQHNFQLFGLDFMLDQDMNVYLIQVNTNPCLQTSCPLLSKIISSVIQNMFKICIDPLFPPPYQWPNQKKMQMGQNALQQNRFILIFDQNQHGQQLIKIYQNIDHNQSQDRHMWAIDQEDQFYQDQGKQWVEQEK